MADIFKTPKLPAVKKPAPMPDPDDPTAAAARRKQIARGSKSSGYTSTLLTSGGRETLGA